MRPFASSSPRLNVARPKPTLRGLTEASAGRVEHDLAAIGRLAADGAVDTLWFDFTTSVNGTLDRESGAIEFASDNGSGETLTDGTHAGDLLPQLALLVMSKGGKVVTVRSDDLDGGVWAGPGDRRAQVRAGVAPLEPAALQGSPALRGSRAVSRLRFTRRSAPVRAAEGGILHAT